MFILVIRNTKTGESRVWQSKRARDVVRRVTAYVIRRGRTWSQDADEFILKNYGIMPTREIAGKLTGKLRRKVTKNAVVGRYRDLKKKGGGLQCKMEP